MSHKPTYNAACFSLLALALLGQLAGCAGTAQGDGAPAAAPLATLPAAGGGMPSPAASAPAAVPPVPRGSQAEPAAEGQPPLIIRGNDRMLAPAKGGGRVSGPVSNFKFEDAPVGEVVHVMLRDLLKVDYVVHPPLKGSVTLVTRGKVSADKAMLLLESALQLNGIVMARDSRGTYHVGTPESLRGIVAAPRQAGGGTLPPGYGAVVIPLQYLGAAEMANILQPMVSPDAIVRVDTLRNILVMRGTRAEAEGWLDLVNTFDVNLLRGMSVGVFPLKHTSAAEVEAALRLLSGAAGTAPGGRAPAPGGTASAGRPPAAAQGQGAGGLGVGGNALGEGNPLFGALRVMPIERLNAVLVVTPRAAYLDEVRYWIEQFDRPNLNSAEPQLFVYKVRNGSADHLAELLNGIYGGVAGSQPSTGATGVAPGLNTAVGTTTPGGAAGALRGGARGLGASMGAGGFGGLPSGVSGLNSGAGLLSGAAAGQAPVAGVSAQPAQSGPAVTTVTLGQSVRVMADRINNTLLIHATPAEYGRIEATLKRLDIQRAQVLIEASIIEVALRDGLEYGLQWAFKNGVGSRNGLGVLNNGSGSAVAGAAIDAAGAITNAAQGFSYTLTGAAGNLSAMLNALATKSLVKVISSPSLMVLDNHSASIVVGDQQPINVGTTISSTGTIATTNNIQYKDTGVMLNVTPSVNAGDLVTLDINQTVTDVGLKDDVTNQRSFLQRQINSKVAVRSGETLVLGGLIKDNQDNGKSGLPGLSSIPVLGALFGKHNQSSARTELLVVLTPRVLRSDEDARAISRELRDRMRGLSAESRP